MLSVQVSRACTLNTALLRNHGLWLPVHVPHPESKAPGHLKVWVDASSKNFYGELIHLGRKGAQGLQFIFPFLAFCSSPTTA